MCPSRAAQQATPQVREQPPLAAAAATARATGLRADYNPPQCRQCCACLVPLPDQPGDHTAGRVVLVQRMAQLLPDLHAGRCGSGRAGQAGAAVAAGKQVSAEQLRHTHAFDKSCLLGSTPRIVHTQGLLPPQLLPCKQLVRVVACAGTSAAQHTRGQLREVPAWCVSASQSVCVPKVSAPPNGTRLLSSPCAGSAAACGAPA